MSTIISSGMHCFLAILRLFGLESFAGPVVLYPDPKCMINTKSHPNATNIKFKSAQTEIFKHEVEVKGLIPLFNSILEK